MLAFTVSLFPVGGLLDCYTLLRNTWTCFPAGGCVHQRACFAYRWTSYTFSNVCGVVSLVMYLLLFRKARKLRNRIVVVSPFEAAAEEREEMAQRLKRERKANTTFFLLFLALIGVSIPPTAFVLIGRVIIIIIGGTALPTAYTVAEVLVGPTISLLIIIDPIVIMRNKDFRKAIRKSLRFRSTGSN